MTQTLFISRLGAQRAASKHEGKVYIFPSTRRNYDTKQVERGFVARVTSPRSGDIFL